MKKRADKVPGTADIIRGRQKCKESTTRFVSAIVTKLSQPYLLTSAAFCRPAEEL